jgi:hypothetical protein
MYANTTEITFLNEECRKTQAKFASYIHLRRVLLLEEDQNPRYRNWLWRLRAN